MTRPCRLPVLLSRVPAESPCRLPLRSRPSPSPSPLPPASAPAASQPCSAAHSPSSEAPSDASPISCEKSAKALLRKVSQGERGGGASGRGRGKREQDVTAEEPMGGEQGRSTGRGHWSRTGEIDARIVRVEGRRWADIVTNRRCHEPQTYRANSLQDDVSSASLSLSLNFTRARAHTHTHRVGKHGGVAQEFVTDVGLWRVQGLQGRIPASRTSCMLRTYAYIPLSLGRCLHFGRSGRALSLFLSRCQKRAVGRPSECIRFRV